MQFNSTMVEKDHCCLQFSFLSLALGRPVLSVCRFVGGMKVGSSRNSCKPECGMETDWTPDPVQEERI